MKKKKEKKDENIFFDEIRNHLKKEIEGVNFTTEEKKAYFEELYTFFNQAKWKHFQPWEKTIFFKQWFVAISNEYIKAVKKFELLKKQNLKEAIKIHRWAFLSLGVPLEKRLRNKNLIKANRASLFSPITYFESDAECSKEINISCLKEILEFPGADSLKIFLIDVKYPRKAILEEVKKLVATEQKVFFKKHPEIKPYFIKQTCDGCEDIYPFDEWERYLKIYMLKQLGKTNRELVDQFYHDKKNVDPKRQILRDSQKAKNLSKNALTHSFFAFESKE